MHIEKKLYKLKKSEIYILAFETWQLTVDTDWSHKSAGHSAQRTKNVYLMMLRGAELGWRTWEVVWLGRTCLRIFSIFLQVTDALDT